MLEIKSLVTNILLNYEIRPVTRVEDVVFVADIVLRPKYPVKVKFVPRHRMQEEAGGAGIANQIVNIDSC